MDFKKSLVDFLAMPPKKFWELVTAEANSCSKILLALWEKAKNSTVTQEEAVECLNCLFIDSHKRIADYSVKLKKDYPTKQYTKNRLLKLPDLWWVDHFTAGISKWGTLNWFSAALRKKKNGTVGLAGASTHFVVGYHDLPFFIIPLQHGAWHEPRKNKDSIAVEHVNCGKVFQKDSIWHFWAGALPLDLVRELPPVLLDKPYRGCKAMQPYTQDQIINNIVLKRLVIAALPGQLDLGRMSQHTDWRDGKTDMGVLWPFKDCNDTAFSPLPIDELRFIQDYAQHLDELGTPWTEKVNLNTHDETENPEYGENTPTKDDDEDSDPSVVLSVKDVQLKLNTKGFYLTADGVMGPKTQKALKQFQQAYNNKNANDDQLKVDGIPGPKTCAALLA
jgi:N-acetyl-anhydromuramyl-L-alanine amidase AmpD